jgi:hypothetical protein
MSTSLRFHLNAPKNAPKYVRETLGLTSGQVELQIKVTEINGVSGFGFAFGKSPVPMDNYKGQFHATPEKQGLLQWVMVGDPGGTMHVTVTDSSGKVVAERKASTISPPDSKAYDALGILV